MFLLDVLDNILPTTPKTSKMTQEEVRLYEEERRLYYVAITRAKRELYLFDCVGCKSSFTEEALAALPESVMDQNDAFSMGPDGKPYRDEEEFDDSELMQQFASYKNHDRKKKQKRSSSNRRAHSKKSSRQSTAYTKSAY